MLTVLSLGAGVQSTTMALMAAHGEITPMPDCAIFADTQHEPHAVYEHLEWLKAQLPFAVHVVTRGDLWQSVVRVRQSRENRRLYTATGIPVYLQDGLQRGIGRRQCTRDFKIDPINRKVRELAGVKRVTKKHGTVASVWVGISADEHLRRKPSQKPYIAHRWPLLEKDMDRDDCFEWLAKNGYPRAPRSACTFCPFRNDDSWLALSPEEFAEVARKEIQLQETYARTSFRGVPFFHASRRPIGEVTFTPAPSGRKARQLSMFNNECAGMCGV